MRIQLKQHEIEAALKGYISQQGIAIDGKAVVMTFKSGRKNNGLSVVMVIDDADAVTSDKSEEAVVVDQTANAVTAEPAVLEQAATAVVVASPEDQGTMPPPVAAPAATASLFGG